MGQYWFVVIYKVERFGIVFPLFAPHRMRNYLFLGLKNRLALAATPCLCKPFRWSHTELLPSTTEMSSSAIL